MANGWEGGQFVAVENVSMLTSCSLLQDLRYLCNRLPDPIANICIESGQRRQVGFPPDCPSVSISARLRLTQISWNALAADFAEAIETLSNVEKVEVTKDTWTDETGFDYFRWRVSEARIDNRWWTYQLSCVPLYDAIIHDNCTSSTNALLSNSVTGAQPLEGYCGRSQNILKDAGVRAFGCVSSTSQRIVVGRGILKQDNLTRWGGGTLESSLLYT